MAWNEKYGAIWNLQLDEGDVLLKERFLPAPDVVTLIVQRRDGLIAVSVLQKARDEQWRLPFWGSSEAPALVETMDDAEQYLSSTLALLVGHS